jgi:hypothetical protein
MLYEVVDQEGPLEEHRIHQEDQAEVQNIEMGDIPEENIDQVDLEGILDTVVREVDHIGQEELHREIVDLVGDLHKGLVGLHREGPMGDFGVADAFFVQNCHNEMLRFQLILLLQLLPMRHQLRRLESMNVLPEVLDLDDVPLDLQVDPVEVVDVDVDLDQIQYEAPDSQFV